MWCAARAVRGAKPNACGDVRCCRGAAALELRQRRFDHAELRPTAPAMQDKRNHCRKWGRAFRGERTKTPTVFLRGKRFSVVPVLSYWGLIDWYIVEGGLDAARFLDFVQLCVVGCTTLEPCSLR